MTPPQERFRLPALVGSLVPTDLRDSVLGRARRKAANSRCKIHLYRGTDDNAWQATTLVVKINATRNVCKNTPSRRPARGNPKWLIMLTDLPQERPNNPRTLVQSPFEFVFAFSTGNASFLEYIEMWKRVIRNARERLELLALPPWKDGRSKESTSTSL